MAHTKSERRPLFTPHQLMTLLVCAEHRVTLAEESNDLRARRTWASICDRLRGLGRQNGGR